MTHHETLICDRYAEWLADALDGGAAGGERRAFEAHLATCADCRDLRAAATEGRTWLRSLDEVEPPSALVHNILAATVDGTPGLRRRPERLGVRTALPQWLTAVGNTILSVAYQPRLAMTGAMAFFSLSMIANVTGASRDDLRQLNPGVLVSHASLRYHEATAGVVRYYENNRFVRELEVQIRDLRDAAAEPPANETVPDERETESHG